MSWHRWWDGTCHDGKFQIVARNAGSRTADAIAVWAILLEDAAHQDHRGIATRGTDWYSLVLGMPEEEIGKILDEMERVQLIIMDEEIEIINWNKKQFESDIKDPTARDRKRRWREKNTEGNAKERIGTIGNGASHPDTDTESDTDKEISIKDDWPKDYRERFWQAYPRKVAKRHGITALEKARKRREVPFARLLGAITTIDTSDPKFIPHPATWLNRGQYLDGPVATGPPIDDAEFERLKANYDAKLLGAKTA